MTPLIASSNNTTSSLQHAVEEIAAWSQENRLQLNPTKFKELQTCFKRSPPSHPPVNLNGVQFDRVSSAKVLGITIRDDFKWKDHVSVIVIKAARRLYLLRQLKRTGMCSRDLILFFCSAIRCVLEYLCLLFHSCLPCYLSDEIECIQHRFSRS